MLKRAWGWLTELLKLNFTSMLYAFVMTLLITMMLSEDNLLALLTSPSQWLPKIIEYSGKPFVWFATFLLIMFFGFLRTLWKAFKYFLMVVTTAIIGFVIAVVMMNYYDELTQWIPSSQANSTTAPLNQKSFLESFSIGQKKNTTTAATGSSCQQISCVRIGSRRTTPPLPATPELPTPAVGIKARP